MSLKKIKKIYMVGIKGAGMAALAEILKENSFEITGSDTAEKFYTDEILKKNKIKYFEGFNPQNIPIDTDLVIYSTAYNILDNVELKEALRRKLTIKSYPQFLGEFMLDKLTIAVCGTHGKTTTTACLAECLRQAGAHPSAIVGAKVLNWRASSLAGRGKYFVVEADEYQNKLKYYHPLAAVITSIDWDHPDFFSSFEEYKKVFVDFVSKLPKHGFLVVMGDSRYVLEAAGHAKCQVIRYGFLEDNDVRIANYEFSSSQSANRFPSQKFDIFYKSRNLGRFETRLVGRHNVLNAAAVVAVSCKLNLDLDKVRLAIKNFKGTSRRFEFVGTRNGAILIDDYAHHPTEVSLVLRAAREMYPQKNIIAVFQPHTFTRTQALLEEFAQCFTDADRVVILDIYASAREKKGKVSSADLKERINKYFRGKAELLSQPKDAVSRLKDEICENDVVISLGAGDVWQVTRKLSKSARG